MAHDWIELAAAMRYDLGRAVVAVVHGDVDYYYDLAVRHQTVIDAFVTYTERIRDGLNERLPRRAGDIHLIPYGVEVVNYFTMGEEIYASRCAACHGADRGGDIGPELTGMGDWDEAELYRTLVAEEA